MKNRIAGSENLLIVRANTCIVKAVSLHIHSEWLANQRKIKCDVMFNCQYPVVLLKKETVN